MSWPCATSAAAPSATFTVLIVIALMTPLALTSNYTENNNSIVYNVIGDAITSETTETNHEENDYVPYSDRPETYFVPVIMLLIMVIGLTGNGLLAFIILRHDEMRNVPNTYVLSLALGDLLVVLINVPFTFIVYVLDSWPFGLLLCKIGESAKDISVGVSVFTLTALAADRFFAIADPMRRLHVTGSGRGETRFTVIIAVLIWLLAIICAIPATFSYIRFFRVNRSRTFLACYPFPPEFGPNYPKMIVICRCVIYYVVPLGIITVFYMLTARHLMRSTKNIPSEMQGQVTQVKQVKARKRVATMVVAFVIIFAICFFPQHVFMLWFHMNPNAPHDYNDYWHYFRIVGFCLAFTNSCINPIALYFVSGAFRKYFNRYLPCCAMRRMRRRSSDLSTRGRGQSSSLVNSRKYLGDSRREPRSMARLSIMVDDIRESTPIKEQETTLSTYPNGTDESLRNQRISTEPTARDRLIT